MDRGGGQGPAADQRGKARDRRNQNWARCIVIPKAGAHGIENALPSFHSANEASQIGHREHGQLERDLFTFLVAHQGAQPQRDEHRQDNGHRYENKEPRSSFPLPAGSRVVFLLDDERGRRRGT